MNFQREDGKVFVAEANSIDPQKALICVTRYGNVIASRESVILLFIYQIKKGEHLTVTNLYMLEFLMSLEEAVNLLYMLLVTLRMEIL